MVVKQTCGFKLSFSQLITVLRGAGFLIPTNPKIVVSERSDEGCTVCLMEDQPLEISWTEDRNVGGPF